MHPKQNVNEAGQNVAAHVPTQEINFIETEEELVDIDEVTS